MEIDVAILEKLIRAVAEKAGKSVDRSGLISVGEIIGDPNPNYLYKNVWRKLVEKEPANIMKVQPFKINLLLNYLGFPTLDEFREHIENPISPQQMSLIGSYYSYLRANSQQQSEVLRSPARIYRHGNVLALEIKGKDRSFIGELSYRDTCLFARITSKEGKGFHHVYKIGGRHEPKVLQGVFSGVTTAFDPIAGRAVLIRQEVPFDELTHLKADTAVLLNSENIEERAVGRYFKEYYNNNISTSKSYEFGLGDLIP